MNRKILFSSGPTRKHPAWSFDNLKNSLMGRSHRALPAKQKLAALIDKTREILTIPMEYLIAIMPGSATGSVEAALWNFLGPRPVTAHVIDVFSA
ncbi:MAG: phosphoserine aminotransferase, partial [Alphaproteobacteria bacterium]|nr:phosphoserine aminotransferase [Alphaproteobacteria bacterium]